VNWLRVFFAGGVTSYRALFAWVNPWVFVPMLVAYPLFQILFFAYLGRSAGVGAAFFLIGDSFVAAAITGLFGMGHSIGGERRFQTLPILLASPTSRLALFLGRSVPTVVNGFAVAAISFGLGAWLLDLHFQSSELAKLSLALVVSCLACTALGLCIGALGLRGRSVSVFADFIGALMLIVSGANVPFHRLPHVVRTIAAGIPLTHGIKAARQLVNGASVGSVGSLLGAELGIAVAYFAVGVLLLRVFERQARASGSFESF
jgi:ABC-2 type transport system permease protein